MAWLCVKEARPTVQLIFALRFLAGASFVGPLLGGEDLFLWTGLALWACLTLSVYVLNGAMDVEEDLANNSSRPIARGELSVRQAVGAAVALGATGVVGTFLLAGSLAWYAAFALVLGWAYSAPPFYLKRYPAGLAIAAALGGLLTYTAGYKIAGAGGDHHGLVVFGVAMALWMGLVGQTKDLSDVRGDREAGRRSGPVVWGESTARILYAAMAVCLGKVFALCAAVFATKLLVPAGVLIVGSLIVAVLLLGPWSSGCSSKRRRPYRAFMATQYAAHLVIIV